MSREHPFERKLPLRPPKEEAVQHTHTNARIVLAIAIFAVLSFYGAAAMATRMDSYFLPGNEFKPGIFANLPGVDNGVNPAAADVNQRINILVMGLDRRADEPKDMATRTDTVFIMTIDPFSKTEGILSIPRDLLVDIPNGRGGYFKDRINVVYEYGAAGVVPYSGGGPALIKDTIKKNFDIPIDNYVVLDFANFIDIIDELGGIDINVPEYVVDPSYQECRACDFVVMEFDPGLQHMDGSTALAYSRIRFGSNDLHRIERQQLVMRATAEKAARINFLSPHKVASLYGKYKDAVKTDVSDFRLPGLAALGRGVPADQIKMYSLNDAVSDCFNCFAAVLIADWDKVRQITQQLFLDSVVQSEAARVEVQNATDIPGLANDVAEALTQRGLPSEWLSLADNASSDIQHTIIYNVGNKEYTAKKLAEWLGLPPDRVITTTLPPVSAVNGVADIIILAGADATLGVG